MNNTNIEDIETIQLDLNKIDSFSKHPFTVCEDNDMAILVDSIRANGLITPIIVRPLSNGKYELVSGHRRKRAYEILKFPTIPAIVKHLTDDEAITIMVESNFQRSHIKQSELARALKMRMDAMAHQGKRTDATSTPLEHKSTDSSKLSGRLSIESIGEQIGISREQVRRYIRLTHLVPELSEYVDAGKIALRPAVELSYLSEDSQRDLVDYIDETDVTPSHAQAIHLRKLDKEGLLTPRLLVSIMSTPKPNQKEKWTFKREKLSAYIPKGYTDSQREEYVVHALQHYSHQKISNNKEHVNR